MRDINRASIAQWFKAWQRRTVTDRDYVYSELTPRSLIASLFFLVSDIISTNFFDKTYFRSNS
jgi:hypothetical protein